MRRPKRWELVVYRVAHALVAAVARVYWRLRIEGAENVPASGPFIIAPVHRSNVDSFLAGLITKRRLRFMAKDSLWKSGLLGRVVETFGGFPVRRGSADREALRITSEVIRNGEPLVMFPEGTRKEGPVIEHVFDGPAYVAARTGVPIVPVGIGGSAKAMPRGAKLLYPARVHVIVGEPIVPAPVPEGGRVARSTVRDLSERLRKELQRLFDEAESRVDT